jgi:hypothetical protein
MSECLMELLHHPVAHVNVVSFSAVVAHAKNLARYALYCTRHLCLEMLVLTRSIIYLSLLVSSVSSNIGECLMKLLHHPVAHVNVVCLSSLWWHARNMIKYTIYCTRHCVNTQIFF